MNTVTVAVCPLAPCGGITVIVLLFESVAANGVVTAACNPSKNTRLSGVSPAPVIVSDLALTATCPVYVPASKFTVQPLAPTASTPR